MVQFDEVKFNKDGNLVIKVHIPDETYYQNVYIDSVKIDTQETFSSDGPSTTPVYTYSVEETEEVKTLTLEVSHYDILSKIDGTLFFVWVSTKGTPGSDVPCGKDATQVVRPVIDDRYMCKMFLPLIKSLQCNCTDNAEFINLMLKAKAVQYCLVAEHYSEAIDFWNEYFADIKRVKNIKSCGCGCRKHV